MSIQYKGNKKPNKKEKMKIVTAELKAQFEESHKLEEEIRKNLEAIEYRIGDETNE